VLVLLGKDETVWAGVADVDVVRSPAGAVALEVFCVVVVAAADEAPAPPP